MDDQEKILRKSIIIKYIIGKLTWIYVLMALFDKSVSIKHGIKHV